MQSGIARSHREAFWKIQGWGVALLIFMSFFPKLSHIEEYLFFVLAGIAAVMVWWDRGAIRVRTPLDLPLLLLIAWVLLTIPFSIDAAYSFAEWRKLFAKVLIFYWAVIVFRNSRQKQSALRGVLLAVVIGTAVVSGYALGDFVASGGSIQNRLIRARGPFSNYQGLSAFLIVTIPVVIAVATGLRTRWGRMTSWSVVAVAIAALFFTYTRSVWLGLAAEGIALGFLAGRRRLAVSVLTVGMIAVLGLLALSHVGYQRDTVDPVTMEYRLGVWRLSIQEVKAHPIVGVGYGSGIFLKRFAGYPEATNAFHAHNTFLMVAMGSGVIALLLLVSVLAVAFYALVRQAKGMVDPGRYGCIMAVAIMIVGFVVNNFFDLMFAGNHAVLFWILVAAGLADSGVGRQDSHLAPLWPELSSRSVKAIHDGNEPYQGDLGTATY